MRLLALTLSAALLVSSAAAQTIDRIKETREIRFGFRTDAAPLSFINDKERPDGLSVMVCDQVARAIASRLGADDLTAQFIPVQSDTRFDMVASGQIDLLCGAATITLSRRETVDFSIPAWASRVVNVAAIRAKGAPDEIPSARAASGAFSA